MIDTSSSQQGGWEALHPPAKMLGDASPAVNAPAWIERGFNACQTHRNSEIALLIAILLIIVFIYFC